MRAAALALVLAAGGCASRGAPVTREELVGDWTTPPSHNALRLAADGTLARAVFLRDLDEPMVLGTWQLDGELLVLDFRRGGLCPGVEIGRYRVRRADDGVRLDAVSEPCLQRALLLDKTIAHRAGDVRPATALVHEPEPLPPLPHVGGSGPLADRLIGRWFQPWPTQGAQSWLELDRDGGMRHGLATGGPLVRGVWQLDGDILTFDNLDGLCSLPQRQRRGRYRVAVDDAGLHFRAVERDPCAVRGGIDREIWRRRADGGRFAVE